jgi:hypothetical protein
MEVAMTEFDAIFQWNMSNDEIEVYKLAVCYVKEYKKLFSECVDGQAIRRNSLPLRSDPRKSNVFKHCWKLRRETRGLLESTEYKNYIIGNLTILKIQKGYVGPNAICGDKAWVRYKVWKRQYDAKMAEVSAIAPPPSVSTTSPKIIQQIDRTKKFLYERCEGEPTATKVKDFIASGIFRFWVMTGKVSQFYVVLSPFVAVATDVSKFAEQCSFSPALIREKCTQEVQNYFKHEFTHEFK